MIAKKLIIEFSGYMMVRQPTDPDPYDELRGASGYTFAFGDEPDLNRIIYFQPDENFPVRSHCPPIGVTVRRAYVQQVSEDIEIQALTNARMNLLDNPVLENRNWALTKPGFEPIVPFHIEICALDDSLRLAREDVLDPNNPDLPIWQLPDHAIQNKGARGLEYEPSTVGIATGHRDAYILHKRRCQALKEDLQELLQSHPETDPAIVVLRGRIAELEKGTSAVEQGHPNRYTVAYSLIERFGYFMSGKPGVVEGNPDLLPGRLDLTKDAKWRTDFWVGAWSCDALSAYTQGTLQIPFLSD